MMRRKTKMNNQKYGQEFLSKKEFLKWIEKNEKKINWDFGLWVEWYVEGDEEDV
jgi:hypothetical protein